MLQQTTVPAVILYYKKWLKLFPNVQALARAPLRKVLKAWQGLGYYQRAKNLHKAAWIVAQKFGGHLPQDYEILRKLPGFGPYTTAAVLSLAFGKRYAVLDANVRRVAMRLKALRGEPTPKSDLVLLQYISGLLPQKNIGLFNQAMMELGALLCKARSPQCLLCPVCSFCQAYARGEQEIIPTPKKIKIRKIEAVVAIIRKGTKYLIRQRPSSGILADLWEFPGGKREPKETLQDALHRELREELGAKIEVKKLLIKVQHAYTQFRATLYAFECILKNEPDSRQKKLCWVTLRALKQYPLPSGSAKIVNFLEKRDKISGDSF